MPVTKRAFIHDEFTESTDPATKKVTIACKYCHSYKAAKNTTRQHQHLIECQPYLRAMHEAGIENDITKGVMRSDAVVPARIPTAGVSYRQNKSTASVPRPPPAVSAAATAARVPVPGPSSSTPAPTQLPRVGEKPSLSLAGKIAIVTGGSQGIGAGIALALAERGARVAITYTSESSTPLASALIARIKRLGNGTSAISIRADLRLLTAPAFIVSTVTAAFGRHIDILVNNAACAMPRALGEITPDDYATVFDLNVRAVIFLTQEVLKVMRKPGRVINITCSGARTSNFDNTSLYGASKAALEGCTRAWASQLGSDGTTVNAINPPFILTKLTSGITPDRVKKNADATPLQGRLGTVDDVAQVACFLAEEGSRFITGQVINTNGGLTMY